ncbi:MAG: hypothetical protein K9J77_02270 [Rhodoferax sp.]|nr:hypothetical protein [Rhodoferax sp.]
MNVLSENMVANPKRLARSIVAACQGSRAVSVWIWTARNNGRAWRLNVLEEVPSQPEKISLELPSQPEKIAQQRDLLSATTAAGVCRPNCVWCDSHGG